MTTGAHLLDDPVRAALLGPHAVFAQRSGAAMRYPIDVSPFGAWASMPADADWDDLADLIGPGGIATFVGEQVLPSDWEFLVRLTGVQLVHSGGTPGGAPRPVQAVLELGPADVPDMLDLVARTEPGPFFTRTVELGRYLGVRRDGELIAMAGERLRLPGWTEISAVCTAPEFRGRGLASALVLDLVAGIRARGATPFLHAVATNLGAIRLYGELGFRHRREVTFLRARRRLVGTTAPGP